MSKSPIERMLDDDVAWQVVERDERPSELHATHAGLLQIAGIGEFKCYRLSDGRAVIDSNDMQRFLYELNKDKQGVVMTINEMAGGTMTTAEPAAEVIGADIEGAAP